MRILKFRIWDDNNKKYDYPDIMELNKGLDYEQWTGFYDKKGRGIYENDWILGTSKNIFSHDRKIVNKVIWSEQGWWVEGTFYNLVEYVDYCEKDVVVFRNREVKG